MDLQGRLAVVTGGGSGLGLELSLGFARSGADVVVADLDPTAAQQTAARVTELGVRGWSHQVDVCDDRQVEDLVSRAVSLGGPHILVNNAGGWTAGDQQFPLASKDAWSATLDLNLRAPMQLIQLCVEPMRALGGGVIVNIASSGGVGFAGYGSPEYGAAKAGLIRLTACLADLAGTHGVRVACVVPDWIGLERAHRQLATMSPSERAGTPSLIPPADVVATVLGLVGDDSCAGAVVELWGGEPPVLLPPLQRPARPRRRPSGSAL